MRSTSFWMIASILLRGWLGLPQALDGGTALLGVQPALARARGRFGGAPRNRRYRCAPDQIDETVARVLAVALLGAMALCADDQHAVAGEAAAGEALEPGAHVIGKVGRAAHIETKLDGARDLVDVLPARPRGADEAFIQLVVVDGDAAGDADHAVTIAWLCRQPPRIGRRIIPGSPAIVRAWRQRWAMRRRRPGSS